MMRATMIAGLASASGFMVGMPAVQQGRMCDPMKEESDFKEYDTFSIFLAACAEHSVELSGTVFAPSNKACDEFISVNGPLTKDVCAYHVLAGEVNTDSLGSADL